MSNLNSRPEFVNSEHNVIVEMNGSPFFNGEHDVDLADKLALINRLGPTTEWLSYENVGYMNSRICPLCRIMILSSDISVMWAGTKCTFTNFVAHGVMYHNLTVSERFRAFILEIPINTPPQKNIKHKRKRMQKQRSQSRRSDRRSKSGCDSRGYC